jgi:hypothetical protein
MKNLTCTVMLPVWGDLKTDVAKRTQGSADFMKNVSCAEMLPVWGDLDTGVATHQNYPRSGTVS